MSHDGGISHLDRILDDFFLEEIETDTLNIQGIYDLVLPPTQPSTTGLSLTVASIVATQYTLGWTLSASSSTGLKQGNNTILFTAPTTLSSSYKFVLPGYTAGAAALDDQVFVVTGHSGTDLTLGFQSLRSGTTPTMASSTLKTTSLISSVAGTVDVVLQIPALSVAEYHGSMNSTITAPAGWTVDTTLSTDTNLVIDWANPATVSTPFAKNISGVKIFFQNGECTSNLDIKMPSYDASGYTGMALIVQNMNLSSEAAFTNDTMEFGFSKTFSALESLTIDGCSIFPPDALTPEFGHQLQISLPVSTFTTNSYNNKVLAVDSYLYSAGQPQVVLGFRDPMILAYKSVHTQTVQLLAPSSLSKTYQLRMPGLYDTNARVSRRLSVHTVTQTTVETNVNLEYNAFPIVGNATPTTTNVTLKTKSNQLDGSIYLPNFDPATDTTNKCLRVASNTPNSVTLEFLPKNIVYEAATGDEIVTIVTHASQTDACTFQLPEFNQVVDANDLPSKILMVKESTTSSITLEFGEVVAFDNIAEFILYENTYGRRTILKPVSSTTSTLQLYLPPTDTNTELHTILSNSLSTSIPSGEANLSWRNACAIPSRLNRVFATLKANANMPADNVLRMPSEQFSSASAITLGRQLVLDSYHADGSAQLQLTQAQSLIMKSTNSSHTCTMAAPATLASSYTLTLPAFASNAQGANIGESLRVISQNGADLVLGLVYDGRLFASGASGLHIDLTHDSTSTQSTIIRFPKLDTPDTLTDHYLAVDTAAAGEVQLKFERHPNPVVSDNSAVYKSSLKTNSTLVASHTLSLPAEPEYKRVFLESKITGSRCELVPMQMLRNDDLKLYNTVLTNANASRGYDNEIEFPLFDETYEPIVVSTVNSIARGSTSTNVVGLNTATTTQVHVGATTNVIKTRDTISPSNLPITYAIEFSAANVFGCRTFTQSGKSFVCATAGLYAVEIDLGIKVSSGLVRSDLDAGKAIKIALQDTIITFTLQSVDTTRPAVHNMRDREMFRTHDSTVALASRPIHRVHVRFVVDVSAGDSFYIYIDHKNSTDATRILRVETAAISFLLLK